jgi:hypothetical protein
LLFALVIFNAYRFEFFGLEADSSLVFNFAAAEEKKLFILSVNFFLVNVADSFQVVNILHRAIVLRLQVSVQRVEAV